MKNLIIFGGKGNGTVVLSTIQDINSIKKTYKIIGFVNNNYDSVTEIDGVPVLGDIEHVPNLIKKYNASFVNAITSYKTMNRVNDLFENQYPELIKKAETIVHPNNFLGYSVHISSGCFIGPQNYIGQNVTIGKFCFLHSQCYIARDSIIHDYTYLSPKVYVGAESIIQKKVYIGIGSIVKENLEIGQNAIIGMGSNVMDNVPYNSKFYGYKAKKRD